MAPHFCFSESEMTNKTDSPSGQEAGFSLVEIVVAMFILALVAVSLAPMLVSALKQTASNAIFTQATHLISQQMDAARTQAATCSALTAYANSTLPVTATAQGVTLNVVRNLGVCPSSYPGTVRFTVSVSRTDTNGILASATTLIYVQSAQ